MKLVLAAAMGLWGVAASAQPIRSLKNVAVPEPPGLDAYVRDKSTLVALGKALFWDMQAGSDGRTACATCHFHAGADHRAQNQLADPNNPFPANHVFSSSDFPFRKLADPGNRNSEVLRDTSMRAGSAGTFRRKFVDVVPGQAAEIGEDVFDRPDFISGDFQMRRVTNRNSPSVINAALYIFNFWDGRANRFFNGFNPSGSADVPGVLMLREGNLERNQVRLDNSSLASQASGPILDLLEMSYEGRTWPKLGKKMLSIAPLALQRVASDDSVLGSMARAGGRGLADNVSYLGWIRIVFVPALWESTQLVDETGKAIAGRAGDPASTSEFTQAEYNFSLFWALALQAYQSTLISPDTPFDRFQDGDTRALTAEQQDGMRFYQAQGRCAGCHGGPEFSAAGFSALGGRGGIAGRAFQRTGVRSVAEDAGRGNGTFKSIGLRNVELTGPYFHNGGEATLEQVAEFYARGGDFAPNIGIRPFSMTESQKASLVAFLKALTDERVRYEQAPFDHPELCVPSGHREARPGVLMPGGAPFPRSAQENWVGLAAVGGSGGPALQTFDELLVGKGTDGSRGHTMTAACTVPLP
ncbi:MAG: cytochrome c peroxidase [Bryobacteraceae bacterium]